MRVAALAFGVLAGLVASLILALGGLDVAADPSSAADRQSQAIRFGLLVIGNLGIFGAALTLAAPLAGGAVLLLGAIAWVGAALLMHHSTDLVLVTPPALLLIAAALAFVAHFRRPHPDESEDADEDDQIVAPARGERSPRPSATIGPDDEEVGIPAFAAAQARPAPPARSAPDGDHLRSRDEDWDPRRRQPPPPRARPAFRPIEEDDDDEADEASGFSRFAMGISGMLSFGLYAALATALVLVVWNFGRTTSDDPAVAVADATASTEHEADTAASAPPATEPPPILSQEPTLEPILTGEPIRQTEATPTAPSASPSELVAAAAPSQEPNTFGAAGLSDGTATLPMLSDDFAAEEEVPLPTIPSGSPDLAAEATAASPADIDPLPAAEPRPEPTTPAPGQVWPHPVPAAIAAQRLAPGTGPTAVSISRPANSDNTGL